MTRRLLAVIALLAVAGCSSLPDKPARQTLYDFGPPPALAASAMAPRPALFLPDVEVAGSLETTALLYRLGYEDAHQLRPYSLARWSAPPAQLVAQRLRMVIGRDRPVLDESAATALARRTVSAPLVLRVQLEEFTHHFDSATASRGLVRLRCTLLENTPGGERLVGQRTFAVEQPAPSADAAGGVRALTAATDAAARDIAAWLEQR